jgi:hypothetical protein
MMDSEQKQAESTQKRHGGVGIHGLRSESSFSNAEQNPFEIHRAKAPGKTIS